MENAKEDNFFIFTVTIVACIQDNYNIPPELSVDVETSSPY